MAESLSLVDRTLFCHQFMPRVRGGCFIPARFYISSSSSSCGRASGGLCSSFRSSSSPYSVFFLRQFRAINLRLVLGGNRDKCGFFKKAAGPFSTMTMRRRFNTSATEVAEVDEESRIPARSSLSSPWLMVPPGLVSNFSGKERREENAGDSFQLYNVLEKKMSKMWRKNEIRLPWQNDVLSANESICLGSSHGFLTFFHPHNSSLFLFNPCLLSSSESLYLPLPPLDSLPSVPVSSQGGLSGDFVSKLILSKCDHQEDTTVMAILGNDRRQLAFCKVGDTAWTTLDGPFCTYWELIYLSKVQHFYSLSAYGGLRAWDLRDPPNSSLITYNLPYIIPENLDCSQRQMRCYAKSIEKRYLVESCSGDLLMVMRHDSRVVGDDGNIDMHYVIRRDYSRGYKTFAFEVYKLDFVTKKWVQVTWLGDEALFVGENDSFSLSASNFPGLRKNSIYFSSCCLMDEGDWGSQDMGIFSLEDGSITPFFHSDSDSNSNSDFKKNQPPPVWIIPQPQL